MKYVTHYFFLTISFCKFNEFNIRFVDLYKFLKNLMIIFTYSLCKNGWEVVVRILIIISQNLLQLILANLQIGTPRES